MCTYVYMYILCDMLGHGNGDEAQTPVCETAVRSRIYVYIYVYIYMCVYVFTHTPGRRKTRAMAHQERHCGI